ncbi:MAG: hypothetical protein ACI9CD_000504 [Candidatus Deianiraeaceae bacterium]|jgi:hypothetical protein
MFKLFLALIFLQNFSFAEKPNLDKHIVGKAQKWTVLRANPNNKNICYAILYVNTRQGNQKVNAEKPYIMVHYFSRNKMRFSIYFGYNLIQKRPVHMSIDSTQYKLNPLKSYAIAKSITHENIIIDALKGSKKLLIRGEGKNYSYSVDQYITTGFEDALKIMVNKCSFNSNNSSFKKIP